MGRSPACYGRAQLGHLEQTKRSFMRLKVTCKEDDSCFANPLNLLQLVAVAKLVGVIG